MKEELILNAQFVQRTRNKLSRPVATGMIHFNEKNNSHKDSHLNHYARVGVHYRDY